MMASGPDLAPSPEPRLARARNGVPVALDAVPTLALDALRRVVIDARHRERRIAALFAVPAAAHLRLYAVLACDADSTLLVGSAVLEGASYPALTPECPAAQLFERELAEQWGVCPEGHPWMKPVRFERSRRPEAPAGEVAPDIPRDMPFYQVAGDEVHEVAVGPVHAGVIEPGHFRFQCAGEQVLHLEISLGYQHRGIARTLVGGPTRRTLHHFETLAGDTTVGHTLAYVQALEALAGVRVPPRAQALRAIALELERLANHVGGLGALANDVGYLPTASYCGRLRGDYLNLTALICGSRFGRGLVRPGGVGFDVDEARAARLQSSLLETMRDVEGAMALLWDTTSVQARFQGTGRVGPEAAEALGLVGVAARASGLERDVRQDHPSGMYRLAQIPVSVATTGDVFGRGYVRWLEVQRSGQFVADQLSTLPAGELGAPLGPLRPGQLVVTLVEAWRGEVCHVALTDEAGRFAAYQVIDPSFHNWPALALALRNLPISDFPLCNKSFDLSYCGFDL